MASLPVPHPTWFSWIMTLVQQLPFPKGSGAVSNCPRETGISPWQRVKLLEKARHILSQKQGLTATS